MKRMRLLLLVCDRRTVFTAVACMDPLSSMYLVGKHLERGCPRQLSNQTRVSNCILEKLCSKLTLTPIIMSSSSNIAGTPNAVCAKSAISRAATIELFPPAPTPTSSSAPTPNTVGILTLGTACACP